MSKNKWFYIIITSIIMFLSYILFFIIDKNMIDILTNEDEFFEDLTAFFFLCTSFLFFFRTYRNKENNKDFSLIFRKNIFYIFLSFLFFFGGMEEISWGQRIFKFATPQIMKKINFQREFNFHNLRIFQGEFEGGREKPEILLMFTFYRMFCMFWLIFCIIIPILYKKNKRFFIFLNKINFPIVPLWLGIFFPINIFIVKIIEPFVYDSVHEAKEAIFSFLFFLVSFYFFIDRKELY